MKKANISAKAHKSKRNTPAEKPKAVPLTEERASKLLATKNKTIGGTPYRMFGYYASGDVKHTAKAFVLASVKSNSQNAVGGYKDTCVWEDGKTSFVGTIFWADGDKLRPVGKSRAKLRTAVRQQLVRDGEFTKVFK